MSETAQPLFEFRFVNEARDYAAMVTAMTQRSMKQRLLIGSVWSAAAIATAYWLGDGAPRSIVGNIVLVAPVIAIMVAILLFSPRINGLASRRVFRETAYANTEVTTFFTAVGVDMHCSGIDTHVDWSSVERIIETKAYVFLAISKRQALIVPRRAASSDQAFDDAVAFARSRIRTS